MINGILHAEMLVTKKLLILSTEKTEAIWIVRNTIR